MKSFARAMHFPPIVKYIDACVRHTFLISWHGFSNGVTKYMDARMCDTIVSDGGAGASIGGGRAQPSISVSSSSNSMRFVTHALVQTCAAGARMTSRYACPKGCGRTYTRKDKRDYHAKKCKGPKTCPVPNCSYPDIRGNNIIGCVFEVCANLDRTAKKRNQLHGKAHQRETSRGIQGDPKQVATEES